MAFNHTLTRAALRAAETGEYDVIHAHDWLVTHTAVTLKEHLDLPLVATIHATEAGRHQGWLPERDEQVHPLRRVVARRTRPAGCSSAPSTCGGRSPGCSSCPTGRVEVVPNGVDDRRLAGAAAGGHRGPGRGSPATARWSGTPAGWSTRRACRTCSPPCRELRRRAPRPAGRHRRRRARTGTNCSRGDPPAAGCTGRSASPASSDRARAARAHRRDRRHWWCRASTSRSAWWRWRRAAAGRAARGRPHRRAGRDRRARRDRRDVPGQRPGRARRVGRHAARRRAVRPPGGHPGQGDGRRAVRLGHDRGPHRRRVRHRAPSRPASSAERRPR